MICQKAISNTANRMQHSETSLLILSSQNRRFSLISEFDFNCPPSWILRADRGVWAQSGCGPKSWRAEHRVRDETGEPVSSTATHSRHKTSCRRAPPRLPSKLDNLGFRIFGGAIEGITNFGETNESQSCSFINGVTPSYRTT